MVQMSVPVLVKSCSHKGYHISVTVSHHSSVASILEPAETVSCLPTDLCVLGETVGLRESCPPRRPGRPLATLLLGEPSLCQRQSEVIRGTVQEGVQLHGTRAGDGQFPPLSDSSLLVLQLNFGENRSEQGEELRSPNCLKCFHCSKLS